MQTRDFFKDPRNSTSALMFAGTLAAWALALLAVPSETPESVAPAALPVQSVNLNALIDFLGAAGVFMLSGAVFGLLLVSFFRFPAVGDKAFARPAADVWQAADLVLCAALFLFIQSAFAALMNWLWFFGLPLDAATGILAPASSAAAQLSVVGYLIARMRQSPLPEAAKTMRLKVRARDLMLAPLLYWPFVPAVTVLALISAMLMSLFGLAPQAHPLTETLLTEETGTGTTALLVAFAAVLAPFCEETFFRGALFAKLRTRTGFFPAAACSAALFSLCHLNPVQFLPVLALGILLAYAYEATGNLLVPICLHALNNVVSLAAVTALGRIYS